MATPSLLAIEHGARYRVTANTIGEYLTVGETYQCSTVERKHVALHRTTDGAGTFVPLWKIRRGFVMLEQVSE